MKKYTITDKEWESVLNKVQTLEKENQRLTGVIEGMNKAFSLYGVSQHRELLFAYERRFINENRYESNEDIYKRVDKFLGK